MSCSDSVQRMGTGGCSSISSVEIVRREASGQYYQNAGVIRGLQADPCPILLVLFSVWKPTVRVLVGPLSSRFRFHSNHGQPPVDAPRKVCQRMNFHQSLHFSLARTLFFLVATTVYTPLPPPSFPPADNLRGSFSFAGWMMACFIHSFMQ